MDRNRFRDVVRLPPLSNGSVPYLKRFHPGDRKKAARRAEDEFGRIRRFAAFGFPGPALGASGREESRAFLLFLAPPGTLSLVEYLRASSAVEARRLLHMGAALLARIHAAGIRLPDLSARHVQVTKEGAPYFIDLARARFHGKGRSRALLDLARLSATLEHVLLEEGARRRFLRTYLHAGGKTGRGGMGRWIRRIAVLERRVRKKGYYPQPFPVQEIREGDGVGYWNVRFLKDWEAVELASPSRMKTPSPPARMLRDLDVRRNYVLNTGMGSYYLKVHRERNRKGGGGAGPREWRNHLLMGRAGLGVPEAVCFGYGPGYSFFASRALEGMTCDRSVGRFLAFSHGKRACLVEGLARYIARLHRWRLYHRDLYLCHVVEEGSRFFLIDLERLREAPPFQRHRRRKDLAAMLYATFGTGVTRTDRIRFFRTYRGGGKLGRAGKRDARAVQRKAERILVRERRMGRTGEKNAAGRGGG